MTQRTTGPVPWAIRLTKLLNQFHAVHGGDRFPVNVEMLAMQVPELLKTGEAIVIRGQALDPEFEGALFNLNAGLPGKGSWAIIYNQAIKSSGRIRFTLAHELGHYLLHRTVQESFSCSEADMLHWDSTERQLEIQADLFASYLLMPIDDYRSQLSSATVDLDILGGCATRYGVSLTAAILKWLEFTPKRAVLVMSRGGVVQWARGSESGKWLSIALNKEMPNGQRVTLPAQSATVLHTDAKLDRYGAEADARVWFPREPDGMTLREMCIVSDRYRQTITLLVLPPEVKPWDRDKPVEVDDDGLENTFDRLVRNGR